MKKTFFTLLFTAFCSYFSFSQLNMSLLSHIPYSQSVNDIWGWVDPDDGTEYALVGTATGLSIVSLADPANATEVKFVPGANSTWRDIKSWGDFVYVTNETANGLMVVDMTDAPNNITSTDWAPALPGLGTLKSCHNLFIDEFGYCYLAGSNINSGGVLIVDVFSNPGNPEFVSAMPSTYSHDVYARNNRVYSSQIFNGDLAIYDVTDKQNVTLLASQQTPFNFTHNSWLNDAGDVVFTTDEKANAPVTAYDISDLDNIVELDEYRPIATLGEGVIPHNVHVWNDWLVTSYYTDGGIIIDAARPDNLIEVGNFDTFFGAGAGFNGAWGLYPFLPSGIVLVSDIGNGLYVLGATYVRAAYLEGNVTDAITGLPINNASIAIDSEQPNLANTDLSGDYKTGQALAGTFDVNFSAAGYESKTVQATLDNGVLTILDVQLTPISSFQVSGQTIKAADGSPVEGAIVVVSNDQFNFTATTDANGNFAFPGIFAGQYDIYAGKWGYLAVSMSNFSISGATDISPILLEPGYQDDFILDLGWQATGNATTGLWERGEPVGTTFGGSFSNPDKDIDGDLGDQCYVTGNGGGGAGDDDVDNGTVTLTSPPMDLTTLVEPAVTYYDWFFNDGGNGAPNDKLKVRINNGMTEVVIETISSTTNGWTGPKEIKLSDFIAITDNMRIIFETSDLPTSGHLVEAAVDAFLVIDLGDLLTAGFSQDVAEGCGPLTVQFSDTSFGQPTSWLWSFPGGDPATSTEQNPTVVYNTPGTYDVTLEVSDGTGGSNTLAQEGAVTVQGGPQVSWDFQSNDSEVSFTNTTENVGGFFWDFGDGTTSMEENPVHSYSESGEFTVTLTASNACGSAALSQVVTVIVVAVNELDSKDFQLVPSPNPFSDQLNVRYELQLAFDQARLSVFNMLGQQMDSREIENQAGTLLFGDSFPQGLYFLRLEVDGKISKAFKVVKIQ